MRYNKAVFLDVDGTLTVDTIPWKLVHDYFFPDDLLDTSIFTQDLDFDEWAKNEVKSWKGKKYRDLQISLEKPLLRNGVSIGIEKLRDEGFLVILLSGGLHQMVENVIEGINIDHFVSNKILQDEGIINGKMDFKIGFKEEYILQLQDELNIDLNASIGVGNAENDIGMFNVVGYSIAFNPRTEIVSNSTSEVVVGNDFAEVVKLIIDHDKSILP
ncbi:MAG: HAD family phosphatase [Candidatus Heimdallarchaeota archaeon]|nr:HAD family phosphatase [Candidatus Heimdallarchaeota archaeon]